MKKNVASQSIGAEIITAADGTAFTGSVSVLITKDNGTQTAGAATAPAHEGNGYHSYSPTQAETNADHIAFTFIGTGAIPATVQLFTSFPQTVDNDTKISLIPTTAMRGTDSANTVVPPSVAQFNARTIVSADYFDPAADTIANVTLVATTTTNTDMRGTDSALLASGYTAPDNAGITQTQTDIAALNDLSSAQVNAEILDVLVTDTFAEVTVPGSTASIKDMIHYTFSRTTAKTTQTATTLNVRNTGDSGNLATATVSDDGTTFTKGKEV
jgi:hypothetical protein